MKKTGPILGVFMLSMLVLPAIQQWTQFWDIEPLNGDIQNLQRPEWSVSGFFEGAFQAQTETWSQSAIGFQPALVRSFNEFHYRAFETARANGVLIGHDPQSGLPVLFEADYLAAFRGEDGVAVGEIDSAAMRLAQVHQELKKRGIPLLVVIAPNKARFFPSCLPPGASPARETTYSRWKMALERHNLPYLDGDSLIRSWKGTSPHPLFSPTGVHWTRWGAMQFAPYLLDAYSIESGHAMPQFEILHSHVPGEARWKDDDIELGMNLWSDLPDGPLAYASYEWTIEDSTDTPKVLVSGDSFYWALFNFGFSKEGLGGGSFSFYHQSLYPESFRSPESETELLKQDGIILMFTDATFRKSLFPFLVDAEGELGFH